ncbi:MAG TPA: alpha/beta hydrolase [Microscillaceae bacterium]|nr:alpha/beta hydrolase [Microscillaceae bacterium]
MLKKILYVLLALIFILIGAFVFTYRGDVPVDKLKAKYANQPSKFITVKGGEVHYRDEGQGFPLVLIHGTGASLHTWEVWSKQLSKDFRVIRFDLPAYGLTGPDPKHDYRISAYVDFVKQFLDKLAIKKCHIAGNSLGGNISWQFALNYPDRVDKMILLDASGIPTNKKSPWVFRLAKTPVLNKIVRYATPRFFFRNNLKQVYSDDSKITEALVDQYYDLMLREGNREAFLYRVKVKYRDKSGEIKRIKNRTLIMWGKEDAWIPVKLAHEFNKRLPNSELIIYPNVGHVPMEEIPNKTVADALKFLKTTHKVP